MKNKAEGPSGESPKIKDFKYDSVYRKFPDVLEYKGKDYDIRSDRGDSCIYRMTAEYRLQLPEPDYLEVDRDGNLIREWKG